MDSLYSQFWPKNYATDALERVAEILPQPAFDSSLQKELESLLSNAKERMLTKPPVKETIKDAG